MTNAALKSTALTSQDVASDLENLMESLADFATKWADRRNRRRWNGWSTSLPEGLRDDVGLPPAEEGLLGKGGRERHWWNIR